MFVAFKTLRRHCSIYNPRFFSAFESSCALLFPVVSSSVSPWLPSFPSLPKEAQACLAGDMQRVAKLLATKADYEVIREIAKLDNPEQATEDWDRR